MKSSLVLATACATLALATPLVKTEIVFDYVTVTVTAASASPTAQATEAPVAPASSPAETPAEESPEPSSDAGAFFSANNGGDSTTEQPASSPAPQTNVPAVSVDTSNLSGYAAPILEAHNKARAQHSAPPLEWDDTLATIAQTIGQTCVYKHNTDVGGIPYGQNIAAGAAANSINDVIYNAMYREEIVNYQWYGGEPDISSLSDWGHASQIIWVGTTKVGCATVTCDVLENASTPPIFTVCNYSPAGNMIGSFAQNVLPN